MPAPPRPMVYLVGAGPGHPGYLTLRGVECLAQADVVLYDKLVPAALLAHAPPTAQRLCVSALGPSHHDRCEPIGQAMLAAAQQGKCVVRLKGGDPSIFGRSGEELELLQAAGIPFEVVPGVTAALGAAACAGIPLTHRQHSSGVAFITGHEYPDKPASTVDWASLAHFPGTLVIYMGISRLQVIARALMQHGKPADTPVAVVHQATTGYQATLTTTLDQLPAAVIAAGISAPAVIIIGEVVRLRHEASWLEQLPLFGQRVLVTRPAAQAQTMAHQLELLGAIPFVLPAVEIRPLHDWTQVDATLARLADFDWLVFTSANGVQAFLERLRSRGKDWRALGQLRLAAIGPRTADTLRGYYLEPDLVPATFRSEELAAALLEQVRGQRVLLARASRGRDVLPTVLRPVADVTELVVYEQCDAIDEHSAALDHLRRGEIDTITLTSPNIARALLRCLDATCRQRIERGQIQLVTISPVTSAAVRELGLPVAWEATTYTTEGMLDALVRMKVGRVS